MALKKTSETIQISTHLPQSGVDAFTQKVVDLQLNPLDNEVFVVTAVRIDLGKIAPDTAAATYTPGYLVASVTTTSQTDAVNIDSNAALATAAKRWSFGLDGAGNPFAMIAFEDSPNDVPDTNLDYVGIISTNDFYVQINSDRMLLTSDAWVRVYGYRARADAATYAALVQSEVLSS